MKPLPTAPLAGLLSVADAGTWGDEPATGSGSPVLRSSNIQNSQLVLDEYAVRHIPPKHADSKLLKDGDIIVTTSSGSPAHIGKCALFRAPDDRDYYFSNFTLRLRASADTDARWIYYWLCSEKGRAVLDAMNSTTSGLRNLNKRLYLAQRVPRPPLPEQRRIAAILDKADAIRRKRREAIALTEELLRSTFLEMLGDPVTNPRGWPTVSLGALIKRGPNNGLYRPAKDYGSGTPIVRIDSFYAGEVTGIQDLKRVRIADNVIGKFGLRPGDILINRVNSPKYLGKSALVPELSEPTVYESNMMRLAVDHDRADPLFVVTQLQDQWIKGQIAKASRDAVNQSSINQGDVRSLQLRLPPLRVQRRFRATVDAVHTCRAKLTEAVACDTELFHSLVQRAFRGEL